MSEKRSSSKKKGKSTSGSKGKKIDETERAVSGAGWTLAATQKFLDCTNDTERINQLYAMFSITDEQYKFDPRSTATIDFHLSNSLFCEENKFDVQQTQFVCRTLDRLLQHAIALYNQSIQENDQQLPNVDNIRNELFKEFHTAFNDLNQPGEYVFNIEQTQKVAEFVATIFIRPIRLLLYQFCHERRKTQVLETRRVFKPIQPVPLSECYEVFPALDESMDFKPPVLPKLGPTGGLSLEDAKQMIQQYTDNVIATINKRYDALEELATKMQTMPSER